MAGDMRSAVKGVRTEACGAQLHRLHQHDLMGVRANSRFKGGLVSIDPFKQAKMSLRRHLSGQVSLYNAEVNMCDS